MVTDTQDFQTHLPGLNNLLSATSRLKLKGFGYILKAFTGDELSR